jgi:U2 small nuclear ribonucleoprotein A'
LPSLRLLDFKKIKQSEKLEANALFKTKKGKELLKEIQKKSKLALANGADAPKSKG